MFERIPIDAMTAERPRRAGVWARFALSSGAVIVLLVAGWTAWAQRASLERVAVEAARAEFHFARLAYPAGSDEFRIRDRWLIDWPEAEEHLLDGVSRLTRIDVGATGAQVGILDDELFEYPWLYAVEVGGWSLGDEEAARLREYLLRGGFLMVDDFHGSAEWSVFERGMRQIFPDLPIVEIPDTEAVFHAVYDVDTTVQIPGTSAYSRGVTYERDGVQPHWRGIYAEDGRLMVVICFNMDLGDAWEHADTPGYPLQFTKLAYEHAIDYIVYAMSH